MLGRDRFTGGYTVPGATPAHAQAQQTAVGPPPYNATRAVPNAISTDQAEELLRNGVDRNMHGKNPCMQHAECNSMRVITTNSQEDSTNNCTHTPTAPLSPSCPPFPACVETQANSTRVLEQRNCAQRWATTSVDDTMGAGVNLNCSVESSPSGKHDTPRVAVAASEIAGSTTNTQPMTQCKQLWQMTCENANINWQTHTPRAGKATREKTSASPAEGEITREAQTVQDPVYTSGNTLLGDDVQVHPMTQQTQTRSTIHKITNTSAVRTTNAATVTTMESFDKFGKLPWPREKDQEHMDLRFAAEGSLSPGENARTRSAMSNGSLADYKLTRNHMAYVKLTCTRLVGFQLTRGMIGPQLSEVDACRRSSSI